MMHFYSTALFSITFDSSIVPHSAASAQGAWFGIPVIILSFILNHCRSLTFILIIMCMIMRTLAPHVTCVSPRFILYLTQYYKLCMLYYKFCWRLWHEDILSGFDQKLPALCSRCCTKQSRTARDQTDVLLNVFMCSAD